MSCRMEISEQVALGSIDELTHETVLDEQTVISELRCFMQIVPYWQKVRDLKIGNLIGLWRLNESSGSVAADSSGNGHTGTYIGATLAALTGPDGAPAPLFDGINDKVQLSASGLPDAFNGAEGTVLMWVRLDAATWSDGEQHFMFQAFVDWSNYLNLRKSGSNNRLAVNRVAGGTASNITSGVITTTDWLCVAVTWSEQDDELIFYIDGVRLYAPTTGLGTWSGTPVKLNLSSYIDINFFWEGGIALTGVWDTALSDAEIAQIASV